MWTGLLVCLFREKVNMIVESIIYISEYEFVCLLQVYMCCKNV